VSAIYLRTLPAPSHPGRLPRRTPLQTHAVTLRLCSVALIDHSLCSLCRISLCNVHTQYYRFRVCVSGVTLVGRAKNYWNRRDRRESFEIIGVSKSLGTAAHPIRFATNTRYRVVIFHRHCTGEVREQAQQSMQLDSTSWNEYCGEWSYFAECLVQRLALFWYRLGGLKP
jgi:hypothetical protein